MKVFKDRFIAAFTLLEFLIAVAIIIVLMAIAIPSYIHYMKKSHYSEVVQVGSTYKLAVTACIEKRMTKISDCDAGTYGVPHAIKPGTGVGQVNSVTVVKGVITIIPKATNGIAATDTYLLTPRRGPNGIVWRVSGGACKRRLVLGCE